MTVTIPAYTTVYGAATLNLPGQLRLGDGDHRAPGLGRRRQEVERDVLGRGRRQCNYTCRFIRSGCGSRIPIHGDANHVRQAHRQLHGDDQHRHGYNHSGACGHRHHGSQDLCRQYDGWVGVCHLHDRAQLPGHGGQGNAYGYDLCLRLLCPNHIDCLRPNPNVRDLPSHKWRYHLADNRYLRRANRSNSSMCDRTNQHCLHSLQHSGDVIRWGRQLHSARHGGNHDRDPLPELRL